MRTRAATCFHTLLNSQGGARSPRPCIVAKWLQSRHLVAPAVSPEPLRKHLKEEAKRKKASVRESDRHPSVDIAHTNDWELTVGIEIHAELNTARKLFSSAPTTSSENHDLPNTNVGLFNSAMPGSQPHFQRATLLPALRAAIALDCEVQKRSSWDRKHYFHWDQPNGYQITQYYHPFAKDGHLILTAEDGVPASDLNGAKHLKIGIKQIQMEQDTAKTTHHPPATYHIDLNRAGHPLIEIITLPHIHSPRTASALVRKVQLILRSVDACVTGMEQGGLRADVNVSVRRRGSHGDSSYSGVTGLGQRTEIKNLSSFAAIEAAITAERNRQISVLEAGGVIEGETRGWALGATETTRLRGKEGEVDYRYMPDAELAPLVIGEDLVKFLRSTLPELPDATTQRVQREYGLIAKDANTIVALDGGDRLEFLEETVSLVEERSPASVHDRVRIGKTAANWTLSELGGLLNSQGLGWAELQISSTELADLLIDLSEKQITARTAKQLLVTLQSLSIEDGDRRPSIAQLIDDGKLRLRPLSEAGYVALAEDIIISSPEMVAAVKQKGQRGKIMWFVGQMVRKGEEGTVEPEKAREVVEKLLDR